MSSEAIFIHALPTYSFWQTILLLAHLLELIVKIVLTHQHITKDVKTSG